MALFVLGCAKPENGQVAEVSGSGTEVDYTVLVKKDGVLQQSTFTADAEIINPVSHTGAFEAMDFPQLSYRYGESISLYVRKADCTGEVTLVDFDGDQLEIIPVFTDLASCEREVISISHSMDSLYLTYSYPGSGLKEKHHFLRAVKVGDVIEGHTEFELFKEPRHMIYSHNRLFILSISNEDDAKDEDEIFSLGVFNPSTGEMIHEINLDGEAQNIFRTVEGHIVVSFPKLHLLINGNTLGVITTVRYNLGKEPDFGATEKAYFDILGNLYYTRPTGLAGTTYEKIPGMYDFENNTAILYYYENFLSESERNFEYEIGDTSLVAYDSANNLILVGYQKLGSGGKGGLLRIKPVPGPDLVDNTDLDGIPYEVFIGRH